MLLTLCVTAACGSKKDADKDKPASPSTSRPETTATPKTTDDPPKPQEPAAASPKELVEKLAACSDLSPCESLEQPLIKGGAAVAPDIVKVAIDGKKPKYARESAAKVLVQLKASGTGVQLFEAAKAEADFLMRGPLYAAAAASGDDAVFEAAKKHLMTEAGWDDRIEVNKALVPFGKKTFAWATQEISKTKKFNEVSRYADLIKRTATKDDVAVVQGVLPKIEDAMARGDLAVALIGFGDTKSFDVLLAGLKSADNLERNQAGKQLEDVIDKLPADRRAEFRAATEAAKSSDTADTYNNWPKLLEKLK